MNIVATEVKLNKAGETLKNYVCQMSELVATYDEFFCNTKKIIEKSIIHMRHFIRAQIQISLLWHNIQIFLFFVFSLWTDAVEFHWMAP